MGCRCAERTDALRRAATALRDGDGGAAIRDAGFVARTFFEDAKSGALRQAALQRLTALRGAKR